jgi:hypothetical protein
MVEMLCHYNLQTNDFSRDRLVSKIQDMQTCVTDRRCERRDDICIGTGRQRNDGSVMDDWVHLLCRWISDCGREIVKRVDRLLDCVLI